MPRSRGQFPLVLVELVRVLSHANFGGATQKSSESIIYEIIQSAKLAIINLWERER
jgi:hypothetical protein